MSGVSVECSGANELGTISPIIATANMERMIIFTNRISSQVNNWIRIKVQKVYGSEGMW